jgi:hypothetical protein
MQATHAVAHGSPEAQQGRTMSVIYPMFAMFVLMAIVLVRLFAARVSAVRHGEVDVGFYRLYQGALEPARSAAVARHFANLFEAPVLFYAVCLAALATHRDTPVLVLLAWCYVVARVVHALVHLTGNRIRWRIRAYMASWLVLAALWGVLLLVPGQAHAIVGTWLVKDPNAPFPQHLYVFNADGTMQQANPDAGDARSSDSDGKGSWIVAGNRIHGTWVELLADRTTHQFAGRLEVSFELTVSGDHYIGTEAVRVLDASGNEGTPPGTDQPIEGTRIRPR